MTSAFIDWFDVGKIVVTMTTTKIEDDNDDDDDDDVDSGDNDANDDVADDEDNAWLAVKQKGWPLWPLISVIQNCLIVESARTL